ncbi:unnamed protein product [Bursaphelenchus xylophilus]|uniref:(pine wood nematode) hypothetical protein n=1 Tax=Bursaphelenchus xylophilus TaxID=6326 RepID=A0A1I7RNQ4_BURXY|nr:unnamed protein product [Bursaphelenchus xylophilus]CAG9124220.1 unnamed protein product [Bursaphelenchus xylophilus]
MAPRAKPQEGLKPFWTYLLAAGIAFVSYLILLLFAKPSELDVIVMSETGLKLRKYEEQYLGEMARLMYDQNQREFRLLTEELNRMREELKSSMNSFEDKIEKLVQEKETPPSPIKPTLKSNFAQLTAGASIYSHSVPHDFGAEVYQFMSIPLITYKRDPNILLESKAEISSGLCWPFQGSHGEVTIKLFELANISQISYTHISLDETPLILSNTSPKLIEVYAGFRPESLQSIGSMEFDPQQTQSVFILEKPIIARFVRFSVVSNFGGEFTCLYRLGVHGDRISRT